MDFQSLSGCCDDRVRRYTLSLEEAEEVVGLVVAAAAGRRQ